MAANTPVMLGFDPINLATLGLKLQYRILRVVYVYLVKLIPRNSVPSNEDDNHCDNSAYAEIYSHLCCL